MGSMDTSGARMGCVPRPDEGVTHWPLWILALAGSAGDGTRGCLC
jgi:hypothetical protein